MSSLLCNTLLKGTWSGDEYFCAILNLYFLDMRCMVLKFLGCRVIEKNISFCLLLRKHLFLLKIVPKGELEFKAASKFLTLVDFLWCPCHGQLFRIFIITDNFQNNFYCFLGGHLIAPASMHAIADEGYWKNFQN